MDKLLYEKIKECFIKDSDGEFLEWPIAEQEAAIQRVAESVEQYTAPARSH